MSMNSKLNNAAEEKKKLELGVTVFSDDGKGIEFPPVSSKKYPISISERALREYIARGGEILVIPVEKGRKSAEIEEDRETK